MQIYLFQSRCLKDVLESSLEDEARLQDVFQASSPRQIFAGSVGKPHFSRQCFMVLDVPSFHADLTQPINFEISTALVISGTLLFS